MLLGTVVVLGAVAVLWSFLVAILWLAWDVLLSGTRLETRWFRGSIESTTAQDPHINAAHVVVAATGEIVARAALVHGCWDISFYGPLHRDAPTAEHPHGDTAKLVAIFTELAKGQR